MWSSTFIDEAHKFKKVPFVSKMGTVRGIDTTESQRALNLYLKVRDVQQKNQGYKGVILATGTPVTNTLAEAWTMVRLASPHLLKDFGVDSLRPICGEFWRGCDAARTERGERQVEARFTFCQIQAWGIARAIYSCFLGCVHAGCIQAGGAAGSAEA